jgi:hypothetical protein
MSFLLHMLNSSEAVPESLAAPRVTAFAIGQVVDVPIRLTDDIAGLQFELHYDSVALAYNKFTPGPGPTPTINDSEVGRFRYINFDLSGLPQWDEQNPDNYLGRLEFAVNGSSQLLFVNVLASDSLGMEVPITVIDGSVTLETNIMNIGFTWTNPNPAGRVLKWNFYESTDGGTTFAIAVGDIPAVDTRVDYDVPADTGEHQFYLIGVGQFGGSPPSNTLVLDSGVPLPPVLSFE